MGQNWCQESIIVLYTDFKNLNINALVRNWFFRDFVWKPFFGQKLFGCKLPLRQVYIFEISIKIRLLHHNPPIWRKIFKPY
jgi:hypothetical protein